MQPQEQAPSVPSVSQVLVVREDLESARSPAHFLDAGTVPLDGDDLQVYSLVVPVPPLSFLDLNGRKYSPKLPPPTYLKQTELVYNQKSTQTELMKGFEVPAEGGLRCADQDVLNRQKGVLSSLLAQVATCFFKKGGFVRISLPVRIFEARSTLDKIIDPWRMAPSYLTRAAATRDPLERMKLVVSFAVAGLHLAVTQLKPFNPLLGETLEGSFDDGTKLFCEHISHHPPITAFLAQGPAASYTLSGYYNYKINFSANSMLGTQSGPNNITFADGGTVTYRLPGVKMTGLIMGSRMVHYAGTMRFVDKQHGIKAVVLFDPGYTGGVFSSRRKGSKRDDIAGLIYRYDTTAKKQNKKSIKKLADLKDLKETICAIGGSWLSHLKIGETEYWNMQSSAPCRLQYDNAPLPSDWRFREDLLWLRRENMPRADAWKVELEVQQRHDRELRERVRKEQAKGNGK